MSTIKVKATPEQIDAIVKEEEAILRAKLEVDIANLRNKYQYIQISLSTDDKKTSVSKKPRWTEEEVTRLVELYSNENMKPRMIAQNINKDVVSVRAKIANLKREGRIQK